MEMASSGMASTAESGWPCDGPIEIKQEICIKEECVELNEVPHSNDGIDLIEIKGEDDGGGYGNRFDLVPNVVKEEIEGEVDGRYRARPRSSDRSNERKRTNQNATNRSTPKVGRRGQNKGVRNKVNGSKPMSASKKCEICGYIAKWKSKLKCHIQKHTGEKLFGCKHCNKRFSANRNLIAHLKMHVDDFPFNCSICLEGFNNESEKKSHEIKCTIRRYECYMCKISFGTHQSNLRRHIRIHSGVKPFKCQQCSSKFSRKYELDRHMKTHSTSKFRCSRCRGLFIREDDREMHQSNCNCKVWQCFICGKSFGMFKNSLQRHMRMHSGERPFKCQQCSSIYKTKYELDCHMKTHSTSKFRCSRCRWLFIREDDREMHQSNCNRKVWQCFICGKSFGMFKNSLQNHMRIHSDEKSFKCSHCNKYFADKGNFFHHVKMHSKPRDD